MTSKSKKVLITGGSSGIGFEMSKYFAEAHYDILWVSLDESELQDSKVKLHKLFPNAVIETLSIDLTLNDAPMKVHTWAQSIGIVDVLINNAGIGTYGMVNDINMDKELSMIQTNILAVYILTRLFMKEMVQKDRGTIINISSNSSFQPVPRMNTYASTKAFVRHFSQGLSEEMKLMGSKVKIITVCPSAIQNTPFREHEGMKNVKTFSGLAYTTAEEVAKDVWKGFTKGKEFIVTGRKMRMLYSIQHFIPSFLSKYLVRKETELQ
jgi:uncharacterized protein